jgi:hypothetical protein
VSISGDAAALAWYGRSAMPVLAWSAQAGGFFSGLSSPDFEAQTPGDAGIVRVYFSVFRASPALKASLLSDPDERRYLRLAEFWIEHRGVHAGRPDWEKEGNRKSEAYIRGQGYGDGRPSWGSYAQDHKPVLQQDSIDGHAVRATLLCAGLAAAGAVNERQDYLFAARRLWENLVTRRMYLTGGVAAQAQDERIGRDYALPNGGYLETCASVGAGFFHHKGSEADWQVALRFAQGAEQPAPRPLDRAVEAIRCGDPAADQPAGTRFSARRRKSGTRWNVA